MKKFVPYIFILFSSFALATEYSPLGIGGGGAMSGVSMSPYANLWFVGTDMGTLYRSTDLGKSWNPINHYQATFDSDLTKAVSVGFAADGTTVFHSNAGINPQRSLDAGITFSNIYMELIDDELIKYWLPDSSNPNIMFVGTTKGLLKSSDKGSQVWYYPTSFAIDFHSADGANTIYLTDYENHNNWLMSGVWKTTDHGKIWNRIKQVTHPTEIKIDPKDNQKIYVAAYYQLDGNWGDGGQLYSKDRGATWLRNESTPLQNNARGISLDPLDGSKILYSYFGGGMLYGENPNR